MTKFKKVLFTLGATGTGFATLATMISCGATESKPTTLATTNIAGIDVSKRQGEVDKALKDNVFQKLDIALLTAGGVINDNSFNQSLWEAISKHADQVNFKNQLALETKSDPEISNQYSALLKQNKNVWVLTGFQHGYLFKNWLDNSQNLKAFKAKKVTVIGIDWEISEELSNKIPGQFIALNYKTEESGWVAGYAAAEFLTKKYPADETKRKIAAFGGAAGKGVTDFLTGFLAGIKAHNATPGKEIVKMSHNAMTLDTNFASSPENTTKIQQIVNTNTPQIILPVAGPLTLDVLQAIKNDVNSTQRVIGVDSNQAEALGEDNKSKFFTSIEKRIGSSLYNVLTDLFLKKGSESEYIPLFVSATETNPKNENVRKGWDAEFVGVSKTTLPDDEKTLAQAALDLAIQEFESKKSTIIASIVEMKANDTEYNTTKLNDLVKEINAQTKTTAASTNPVQS